MSAIKSMGEEIRQLAPARVNSSVEDTPVDTPTAKTLSSLAAFMSQTLSPTTKVSSGLTFNDFKAVSKCIGLGFTVGTESRVMTALKKGFSRNVDKMCSVDFRLFTVKIPSLSFIFFKA